MDTIDLQVREAHDADLQHVADLCRQWQVEEITTNYRADAPEQLRHRLGRYFLVAVSAGTLVGFVIGEVKPTRGEEMAEGMLDDQPAYLEVQDLYVAGPRRLRGVGTALMRGLLERAEADGLGRSLVYSANHDYVRTARFYEKFGYRMWHIVMTRKV